MDRAQKHHPRLGHCGSRTRHSVASSPAGSATLAWGELIAQGRHDVFVPRCSSFDLTRDGHDGCGRIVYACAGCGRHATAESASLVSGHRFPRDVILLAVRYYLRLGAAAERIAGVLADRGIDVSGRTIL